MTHELNDYEHLDKKLTTVSAEHDKITNAGRKTDPEVKDPVYLELLDDEDYLQISEPVVYDTVDDIHVLNIHSHKHVPLPPVQTTHEHHTKTAPRRTRAKKTKPIVFAVVNAAVILVIIFIVTYFLTRPTEHGCALDMAFAVDSSTSIVYESYDNWELIIEFIIDIVDQVDIAETKIAVLPFSDDAVIFLNLTNGFKTEAEYFSAINGLRHAGGETNTTGALRAARTKVFTPAGGDRPGVTNLLVLLTDGENNVEVGGLEQETVKVRNSGIRVVAIGITDMVSRKELNMIASRDDKGTPLVYVVQGFSQLESELIHTLTMSKICGLP